MTAVEKRMTSGSGSVQANRAVYAVDSTAPVNPLLNADKN
jgi:hypothetical protein